MRPAGEPAARPAPFAILPREERLEEALFYLADALGDRRRRGKKAVLLHSLRVGFALLNGGFKEEVVLAGLFHDILEKTTLTPAHIGRRFGSRVAHLVAACTNDNDIADPIARYADSLKRCLRLGSDALAVRAADLIDNSDRVLAYQYTGRVDRVAAKIRLLLEVGRAKLDPRLAAELSQRLRRLGRSKGMRLVARRASGATKAQQRRAGASRQRR